MERKEQIRLALGALKNAYAPYSQFFVAAALLSKSGRVYTGINIENASYPAGICAERAAFSAAVSAGERDFVSVVICGGKNGIPTDFCPPCGICRQVMREFADPDTFEIILAKSEDEYKVYRLSELLPESFGPQHLA